jgi:hypothetical protein
MKVELANQKKEKANERKVAEANKKQEIELKKKGKEAKKRQLEEDALLNPPLKRKRG